MDASSFLALWSSSELYLILGVTMLTTVLSTALSTAIGLPLAWAMVARRFPGRRMLERLLSTLMGLPPVVAGLLVFMLLSRSGPLGSMHLLFTPAAMIIAQIILVTPVIATMAKSAMAQKSGLIHETCVGLRLSGKAELTLLLSECRGALTAALLAGFGRAISEVGAVMIVGGNIQYKTRVMTTSIVLETGKGNFEMALTLGLILLIIAFAVNAVLLKLRSDI